MDSIVKATFEDSHQFIMQNPILYGDFMSANPTDQTFVDVKLYEDCGNYEAVKKKFDWLLQ